MTTFPRWIRQITNRTHAEIQNLILEFREDHWSYFEAYCEHKAISVTEMFELVESGKKRISIPFPTDDDCDTWEEMYNKFQQDFGEFLLDEYGESNPIEGSPPSA